MRKDLYRKILGRKLEWSAYIRLPGRWSRSFHQRIMRKNAVSAVRDILENGNVRKSAVTSWGMVSPLLQKKILYTSCTCQEYYARLFWNVRKSAERRARSSEESTPGPGRKAKSIPSEGFICGIVAEPGSWAGAEWHQEQESGLNRDGPFRSGQLDFRKTFLPWKIFSQKAGFFRQMKHHIRIGTDVEKGFVC